MSIILFIKDHPQELVTHRSFEKLDFVDFNDKTASFLHLSERIVGLASNHVFHVIPRVRHPDQ